MRLRDWLAGTIFTVGFLWQFGLRILDWIGRVLAARDAHEWLDGIRQPIEGWFASHPDLSSRIGPWVLMASGLGAILITHIVPWLHSHVRRKDIQLVFPNECNSEFKYVPPFKESSAPLFSGMPAPNKSMHEFYIGIHNPNPQKTLRNVRLLLKCAKYGSYFETYLTCKRSGTDTADISPLMTDYFLVGRGIDDSKSGVFHPVLNPTPEYLSLHSRLESNNHYGFIVFGREGREIGLLRNDGIPLTAIVFADDVPPEIQKFTLNVRDRLSLYLVDTPSILRRVLRPSSEPFKAAL